MTCASVLLCAGAVFYLSGPQWLSSGVPSKWLTASLLWFRHGTVLSMDGHFLVEASLVDFGLFLLMAVSVPSALSRVLCKSCLLYTSDAADDTPC
eukprot:7131879-Pyramimonas_sp.AAC.1